MTALKMVREMRAQNAIELARAGTYKRISGGILVINVAFLIAVIVFA